MKQSIIDVVNDTADFNIEYNFDDDGDLEDGSIEITNAQEVAEDVIKAYLNDIWITFDEADKSTWPLSGSYLTEINYYHGPDNFENMTIMQDFTKHDGTWALDNQVIKYLDLQNLNPKAI